ncbi:hypothetical protein SDC9_85084 [bioreactor metagenome]|uniref:Uncharacterized protein n=2 Tax=root TaxID=1 RepID=A0ABS4K0G2_9CLOT|nr:MULTISPECIES: hypothetical protein [Clostridium]EQB90364.1 hypothetical protein M918_00640 [Clostridium sp. BL8]MBP2021266.1 hypothetical protein [Clostridium punense]
MILASSIVKQYVEDLRKKFKHKKEEFLGLNIIDNSLEYYMIVNWFNKE